MSTNESNRLRNEQVIITYIEDFVGADVERDIIRVSLDDQNLGVVTTDIDQIGGTEQTGADVVAIFQALEEALNSNGNDSLLIDSNNALDVSAAEVDVDLATQSLGDIATDISAALKSNDTDEVVVRTTDPSGAEQTLKQADAGYLNGAALSADGESTVALSAIGSNELNGQVSSSGTYSVVLRWQDDGGNTIRSETVANNVTGGNWTDIQRGAKSDNVVVVVSDESSASQTVNATVNIG